MNPKQFLLVGGGVLVLVGVLGMIGVIGPTVEDSLFGSMWWFDTPENVAHLIIGIVGIIGAFILPAGLQKAVVLLLGVVGLLVGFYSAVIDTNFFGANLEQHADTILHIAVAAWAFFAGMKGSETSASSASANQPNMSM